MTSLHVVHTGPDTLGERLQIAISKVVASRNQFTAAREQWVESTLETAAIVLEGKKQYPDTTQFSVWLDRNGMKEISPHNRAALISMGANPTLTRELMAKHSGMWSWQDIWAKRPNKPQRRHKNLSKSQPTPKLHRGRRSRIPDVMREDWERDQEQLKKKDQSQADREKQMREEFNKPLPDLSARFLKREQVDPDFKGSALDFAAKYGHVPLRTKAEIEEDERQAALSVFLGHLANLDRNALAMQKTLAAVDPQTLTNWLARPSKAAMFKAWQENIRRVLETMLRLTLRHD